MKYYASKNATFSDEKANKYGQALEKIQKRCNGIITPDEVVHTAKSPSNPLHSAFEWDNTKAAHNYRKVQARKLLRVVVVRETVEKEGGTPHVVDISAFTSVVMSTQQGDDLVSQRVYVPQVTINDDEDLYNQTMADALSRLKFWQQRFKMLKELSPIFEAIESVQTSLKV
jgi:hypothetical protein